MIFDKLKEIEFYTYTHKDDKPTVLVLKGIKGGCSPNDVLDYIKN